MSSKTLTFRIEADKVVALDALAEMQERPRSFLLNEAVDHYLELNDYHISEIRAGMRQGDSGEEGLSVATMRKKASTWHKAK